MAVTWHIDDGDDGADGAPACRVAIEHVFEPRVPGWAFLIDRLFTYPIAGRTLAAFRAIAEAVAEGQSDQPTATNLRS